MTPDTALAAGFERMWSELAPIGRRADGGYARYAWTEVDQALRAWFAREAARRDLRVQADRNANLWAWWGGPGPGAVATGSHLDSVPGGGAYDGPLGVVSALLAIDDLRARGVSPSRPLAVVSFVEEEGGRFGRACVGSQLMTGALDPSTARALRDGDGTTLAQAMTAGGADPDALGPDDAVLADLATFLELHVEQGRQLDVLDAPVGVASAIWPHGRWRLRFTGEGNHAGTTRLVDRRDPMLAFASTVLAAREVALREGGVATFGRAVIEPGGTNVIASQVTAWLDARGPDDATVRRQLVGITEAAERAAQVHRLDVEVVAESFAPGVAFAEQLRDSLAERLGDVPVLPTAAGHDAGVLAARVPSAMLFVRNPSGVSHSPREHAETADCLLGVRALATVLEELTGAAPASAA